MLCLECGTKIRLGKGSAPIDVGLDAPVVVNGVEHGECKQCGEGYTFVPRYPQLLELAALELTKKPDRLTAKEIRFLREVLDVRFKEMASRLGIDKTTYAKYEHGKQDLDKGVEMFLRVMLQAELAGQHYEIPTLKGQPPKAAEMTAKNRNDTWTVALGT